MSDYLVALANYPTARRLVAKVGLPTPQTLAREEGAYADRPLAGTHVVIGAARRANSGLGTAIERMLSDAGATFSTIDSAARGQLIPATRAGNHVTGSTRNGHDTAKVGAVLFDATDVGAVADLKSLYVFFRACTARIATNARVLVLTRLPKQAEDAAGAAVRRGVEGFVRSLAKELGKRGATANLAYVEDGAEDRLEGVVRFFLSSRSTFVDGQAVRVTSQAVKPERVELTAPLRGKVALITGAARGIGAATAKRMAEEGARVLCVDIPADSATVELTVRAIGGTVLPLDLTSAPAPRIIANVLKDKFGGVDIVVHNAGITRDKTVAKMDEHLWDQVLEINLDAIMSIDRALIDDDVLRNEGRIVCLSSIAGVAGNVGQTNYATTKAALIGYVAAQAERLAARGITVNAVAPGYIETRMSRAMPFFFRETVRRMNSLSQGGIPQDAAELITFLGTPGACGITGQTIRVCGQNLIGA